MKILSIRSALGPILAGSLLVWGCGKDESDKARFNESLGGRGPVTISGIDMGILEDPAGYKPAGGSSASGGPSAGGSNDAKAPDAAAAGEVDAAKSVVTNLIDALHNLQATGILDSFDSEQVTELKTVDIENELTKVFEATKPFYGGLKEKSPEAQRPAFDEFLTKVHAAVKDNVTVAMTDAENAVASLDSQKFGVAMSEVIKEVVSKTGQQIPESVNLEEIFAKFAGPSGAMSLRKTDGKWRIQLAGPVSKDVAEHLKKGCNLVYEGIDKATKALDNVTAGDEQALHGAMQSIIGDIVAQMTGWYSELTQFLEDGAGAAKKPEDKKEEKPEGEGEISNPRVIQP